MDATFTGNPRLVAWALLALPLYFTDYALGFTLKTTSHGLVGTIDSLTIHTIMAPTSPTMRSPDPSSFFLLQRLSRKHKVLENLICRLHHYCFDHQPQSTVSIYPEQCQYCELDLSSSTVLMKLSGAQGYVQQLLYLCFPLGQLLTFITSTLHDRGLHDTLLVLLRRYGPHELPNSHTTHVMLCHT